MGKARFLFLLPFLLAACPDGKPKAVVIRLGDYPLRWVELGARGAAESLPIADANLPLTATVPASP
jgi:hypothetical protein